MAGWKEYRQAKSGGYWPGLSRIAQDIKARKQAGVWNPGYEIGLARYLCELDQINFDFLQSQSSKARPHLRLTRQQVALAPRCGLLLTQQAEHFQSENALTWLAAIVPRAFAPNAGKPATPTEYQKRLQEQREMARMLLCRRAKMQGQQNGTNTIGGDDSGKYPGSRSCLSGRQFPVSIGNAG